VILADTTVWIDFLAGRTSALSLRSLLAANQVVCHPAVRGEIALGSLARRDEVLRLLFQLPSVQVAGDDEVFALIDAKKLYATGIGWVDAHLLASAVVGGHVIWTGDKRLAGVAERLRVLVDPTTFGSK
jgi:predicted nucleic acid-binding protein